MVPTLYGLIIIAVGLFLLRFPPSALLIFTLFCSLFGAASAINLPALGGSSIQPAHVALGFFILRLMFSRAGTQSNLFASLRSCAFLGAYCIYGAVTAFILPKIFDNAIAIIPMRPPTPGIYDFYPLHFGPQNITAAAYLIGTFVGAVAAAMIARRSLRPETFAIAVVVLVWCHIAFGILDLVLSAAGHGDWLDIFRNGSYAQLTQSVGEIKRIAGTFSETSAYSGFGFFWLVFITELWLRNIKPMATGLTAIAMAMILMITTSSSAYIGLMGYAAILALRLFLTPMNLPLSKALKLFSFAFLSVTLALLLAVVSPAFWDLATSVFQKMTVQKMQSTSGIQRSLWAKQGIDAFKISHGLGIGAGSFRSSSIVSAILGSVGVVGMIAFLAHLGAVFSPFSLYMHDVRKSPADALAIAASWTLVVTLIPALVGSPGPDPGLLFGIMSGIALGMRHNPRG